MFGILKPDGTVDVERTKELIDLARPLQVLLDLPHGMMRMCGLIDLITLQVTFHRAFDMVNNPCEALEDLISLGMMLMSMSFFVKEWYSGGESRC